MRTGRAPFFVSDVFYWYAVCLELFKDDGYASEVCGDSV